MRITTLILIIFFPLITMAQFGGVGSPGIWSPAAVSSATISAVFVKTVSGTNPTTASVNASASTQVFAAIAYKKVATAISISDNGGHSWNLLIQVEGVNTNESGVIVYETHGSFSSALTITVTCNTCGVSGIGFAGTTATTVDQTNGIYDNTGSTSPTSGSITTTRANNVVIGLIYNAGGGSSSPSVPTVPAGYTDAGGYPFGTTFPARVVYKINNSGTTTESVTFSFSAISGNTATAIIDE